MGTQSSNDRIKGQQAGRRLSGNQQRELTRQQAEHPERVERMEEKMKEGDRPVRGTKGTASS
jgi:hypothetical protein